MNYISEINNFYDWLETNSMPKSAIALWNALMHINNKAGWIETFEVAISTLELKTGFKRSELFEARNILLQKGRIEWYSRGGNLCASYRIIQFSVHNTDTSTNTNTFSVHNTDTKPTQTGTINKLNKTKHLNNPPTPLKGDDVKNWRNDFEIYKSELRNSYNEFINDNEFIEKQERYHPNLNIRLSIEKSCVNYWSKEAGWKKKKASKTEDIDWKSTFINALSLKNNQVWLQKGETNEVSETRYRKLNIMYI